MPCYTLPSVATAPPPGHPPPPPTGNSPRPRHRLPHPLPFLVPALVCPCVLLSLHSPPRPRRPCACARCRRPCCFGVAAEAGVVARFEAGVSHVDGVGEAELEDGRGAGGHGAGVQGEQGDWCLGVLRGWELVVRWWWPGQKHGSEGGGRASGWR
ncbi:hypothetical protein I4F81_003266 [Pyropia yezoensis]|uniref:Uncharacterized protein n=1 Tax=Pyropia yezoensis TaxID=2788 RepID=A0ACC3BRY1_PYRYE|nr:hypothetical protein I4F81_003266 [Neopyropia yezoensis]